MGFGCEFDPHGVASQGRPYSFKCPETSLVISNILARFFPLKTALKAPSTLMRVQNRSGFTGFFKFFPTDQKMLSFFPIWLDVY